MSPASPFNNASAPRPPTLWELAPRALKWGLAAALLCSLLYAAWEIAVYFDKKGEGAVLSGVGLAVRSGLVLAISAVIVSLIVLVFSHRKAANQSFTVVGFLATFFGLAMLAVFFLTLVWNTCQWFYYTPKFVEAYNNEKRAEIALAKDTEKYIEKRLQDTTYSQRKQKLALLKQKYNRELRRAGDDRQRKDDIYKRHLSEVDTLLEAYEELLPAKKAELKNEAELIVSTYPKFIREDTSTWGVFWHFLTSGPSNDPQNSGIAFAILGSLWVSLITIVFAVPIGVGAALYLEEYRSKQQQSGWLGNLIQININNLAGIPSVVYGVLGSFVFVELIFKPLSQQNPYIDTRNTLGAGMTLGLLTLPIVIVAAQEAIRAVPLSIRQGAYALGATQWQVIWRNVLPMASPGIFTGTILSVSRAIGEAAPMVLFGALLYVDQVPHLFSRFTVLPMQIFNWALEKPWELVKGSGEYIPLPRYNAALASLVLLTILLGLNSVAIVLRNRAQRGKRE